jgi:hypothetical protein
MVKGYYNSSCFIHGKNDDTIMSRIRSIVL